MRWALDCCCASAAEREKLGFAYRTRLQATLLREMALGDAAAEVLRLGSKKPETRFEGLASATTRSALEMQPAADSDASSGSDQSIAHASTHLRAPGPNLPKRNAVEYILRAHPVLLSSIDQVRQKHQSAMHAATPSAAEWTAAVRKKVLSKYRSLGAKRRQH
eukprot:scaffold1635_cov229-Pinguiococcus_pyrenoidosus.AAC.1